MRAEVIALVMNGTSHSASDECPLGPKVSPEPMSVAFGSLKSRSKSLIDDTLIEEFEYFF
jgi:hypothetical protein